MLLNIVSVLLASMAFASLFAAYGGIRASPTVFAINQEGRAAHKHVGLFNPALYETEVCALLIVPPHSPLPPFANATSRLAAAAANTLRLNAEPTIRRQISMNRTAAVVKKVSARMPKSQPPGAPEASAPSAARACDPWSAPQVPPPKPQR